MSGLLPGIPTVTKGCSSTVNRLDTRVRHLCDVTDIGLMTDSTLGVASVSEAI